MAFRIHFSFEDLARSRVARSPRPLQELSIAMRVWRNRTPPPRLGAWRRETACLPAAARMAFELTPAHGWVPDFLAPTTAGEPEELLERVRATPRRRLREEMARLAARQPVPRWARLLGEDPAVLRQLVDSLTAAHDVLLAPYRPHVESLLKTDNALRARDFLHGGMERVLARLHPRRIRWEPPVLSVTMASGLDADLHLEGRGLLLVPSVFGTDAPVIAPDVQPQPMLFYPASSDSPLPGVVRPRTGASATLAQLLGRTRAAVLLAIADRDGCTTTELSTAVGVSVSSASEHATVLRRTGLIATTRHHKAVLHTITSTGRVLADTA